jgi:hypothetical protein
MSNLHKPSEKVDVRIEVFDDHVMLILPRKMDDLQTPWQEAWVLGEVIEQAANDIPNKPLVLDPVHAELESNKLKINTSSDKKNVVLFFDHTDRIKLSYEAARTVARAIRLVAQDLDYWNTKHVHISYKAKGYKNRPMPFWDPNRFPKTLPTK